MHTLLSIGCWHTDRRWSGGGDGMVDLGGYVIILVETKDKRVKLYGKKPSVILFITFYPCFSAFFYN